MATDDEGYFTAAEFMRCFAIPRSSFYRQVKLGNIRITKIGRASRIAKAEAKAWAESLPTFGGEVRT